MSELITTGIMSVNQGELFQERGTLGILGKASRDFFSHGWPFVIAITPTVLMIYGGSYAGLLIALSVFDNANIPLKLISVLAMLGLMSYGFWRFFAFMASLNASYARLLSGLSDTRPIGKAIRPDIKQDLKTVLKERSGFLGAYLNGFVLVQLVAGVIFTVLVSPIGVYFPGVHLLLAQVLVFLAYTWFSMGFQIIGLGPEVGHPPQKGLFGVIKQSRALVSRRYARCFVLLLISYLVTYYLIPGAVVSLAELSGAVSWFNQFHEGLVQNYLLQIPPEFSSMLEMPTATDASHQISQFLLTGIVNSLLLPWGTFVYALAYGDLLAGKRDESISGV